MFKLNENKYKNVILYLTKKIGKGSVWGKKKMYKLLYFLDFDFFEKYEKPITGDIYHKLQMGPAPSYFDAMVAELKKDKLLKVSKGKSGQGYNDAYVYKALKNPDLSVFSDGELDMLKRIVKKYGNKNGTELEKLTHKEAPYLAVDEGEEIPLELAHYRGTKFN
ncbi:SocA family protein [Patescibacteria group bacterium]|nr:SocA family protein [Patescibacteria group bacterium]